VDDSDESVADVNRVEYAGENSVASVVDDER
jgi:hypothetical protein